MAVTATFRWEFRNPEVARRVYAEGELRDVGRYGSTGQRFLLEVYLVRDEMAKPRKVKGVLQIDDRRRVGIRIYVGTCRDEVQCRTLAYLAPVEGTRQAYTMIFDVLKDNPAQVEAFGDEWLTELFKDFAKQEPPLSLDPYSPLAPVTWPG